MKDVKPVFQNWNKIKAPIPEWKYHGSIWGVYIEIYLEYIKKYRLIKVAE